MSFSTGFLKTAGTYFKKRSRISKLLTEKKTLANTKPKMPPHDTLTQVISTQILMLLLLLAWCEERLLFLIRFVSLLGRNLFKVNLKVNVLNSLFAAKFSTNCSSLQKVIMLGRLKKLQLSSIISF